MTIATVGTFAAHANATGTPSTRYAVATRSIAPGELVETDDIRLAPLHLTDAVAARAFTDVDALVGRRLLAALADGDLVQETIVAEATAGASYQLSLAVPRAYSAGGNLHSGDLVDVYVTVDGAETAAAARGVRVLAVPDGDDGGLVGTNELTIVLEVTDATAVPRLVHAARSGDITLVRSTHARVPEETP